MGGGSHDRLRTATIGPVASSMGSLVTAELTTCCESCADIET